MTRSIRTSVEALDRAATGGEHCESVALHVMSGDKYAFTGPSGIDCDSRLHLCRAACCRLRFALSMQDVREKLIQWDESARYFNAQRADGYCAHVSDSLRCSLYRQRPVACRAFDCRSDPRIWVDFDRAQINPSILNSVGEE